MNRSPPSPVVQVIYVRLTANGDAGATLAIPPSDDSPGPSALASDSNVHYDAFLQKH